MAGLHFRERMQGKLYLIAEPLREISATLELEARFHAGDETASLTGRITIDGVTHDAPIQGSLGLPALAVKRLPYDVFFLTDAGERWRMRGEKDITYLAPVRSLTVLPVTVYQEAAHATRAREVARGTLEFDWRQELGPMIRSLRPSLF
jgi:hypothetical protein